MSDRQRVYRTHAVVLRRRDHQDADRVLVVFTPGMGKQELMAKGVRKTTSRKAGHLEIFTHTALMVAHARTWDIITEAQTVESFRHLRQDLDGIGRASYICELVDAFSESSDENQPLWELTLLALRELDQISQASLGVDPQVLLRWFELHLLSLSGFQPQLFTCLGCDREISPVVNYLSLAEGGIFCPDCGHTQPAVEAIEPEVLKILRHLQRSPWPEVRRLSVRPPLLRRAENILNRYILTVLERQLRSTEFLHRLQSMQVRAPGAPAANPTAP